ncbi:MAG: response regulator transcription factor [Patescibacteria group bacterium]|nr:response regulator transcription factor [Patescibacteria group bacterium]
MKALVIEDQKDCASFLIKGLASSGFIVDWETNGERALWKARSTQYDILLSDLHLPEQSGLEILTKLRQNKNPVPFIMVTVEKELDSKLQAFKQGVDDYIVKPFSLSELVARVRAVLKRNFNLKSEIIKSGDLSLDTSNFRAYKKGKEIELRRKEYDLLCFFMRNPGRTLSRLLILEKVWDMNADPFTNTVDVHIKNLRKKIQDPKGRVIKTIYGRGYELNQ